MRTLSFLVLAGAASAQGFVSPAIFARMEGNTWSSAGIGARAAPARLLQIHEDVPAGSVSALLLRRDGQTSTDFPSLSLVCSIHMSTATTTAAQPDATFANNHGSDRRTVAANQIVQLPATQHDGFAAPFAYRLPLSTPYQHQATGPLCFEVELVTTSSNTTLFFDAASSSNSNPGGLTDTVGQGCRSSGGTARATLNGSFQPNWGARTMTLALNGHGLPQTALGVLALGDSRTQWGALTLPFELPGTASAPSGSCYVLNSMVVTLPQFTTATGTMTASLGYRPHPSMRGRDFYLQMVAPDAAANAWGLVTTNGMEFHPWAPWTSVPIGTVEATNLGATGTVRRNHGQIVRFD